MRKGNKPWFDNECRTKRKHFLQIKRRFVRKKTKTPIDIESLNHEAKMYKKFIQMKTNLYNKNLHEKLRNLKGSKPKEYWNLLNPKKRKINNSININSLYDHFKSLNEQTNTGNREISADEIPDEADEILNNDFTPIELKKLSKKTKKQ